MPLKKLQIKPGINRENTRYTNEGGWYDCDKIRFRQGTPEKIGGWTRISTSTYLGVCRALWNWITLGGANLLAVGTNVKYYIELGGAYNDITPLRATETLTDPFTTTNGSPIVEVVDAAGGYADGDYVTFSGATTVGGLDLDGEYQITLTGSGYTIEAASSATSDATGGGTVTAEYQIRPGYALTVPITGWGAGGWGSGPWGVGTTSQDALRLWSQSNFGEDLIFAPRGGEIYYWDATATVSTRATALVDAVGAANVPTKVNIIFVSDVSRFTFAFGATEYGSSTFDPMLIRWSDQEDPTDWTVQVTSQAGFLRLSHGSEIVAVAQARQEILTWTDSALYALQYQGAPIVWGAQLVGDNISIASQNAVAYANGVAYWMGKDKFYKYDGRTQTLRCDLRQFIFKNINLNQFEQVFAGTNEAFNEVWWFYCNGDSTTVNRYVVYNYAEDIWYYGTMARSAWLDSGGRDNPVAATYENNVVTHESGNNDNTTGNPVAIESYITSSEFDLDDGHQFAFIWRVLPDITFRGSDDGTTPTATMVLLPMKNSGSGYTDPTSVGGSNEGTITRTQTGSGGSRAASLQVEEYTGQIFTRVRGRQLAMQVYSDGLGVAWQLGSPRLDMRPDGRR
jgi:hypothetical protein